VVVDISEAKLVAHVYIVMIWQYPLPAILQLEVFFIGVHFKCNENRRGSREADEN
jgi:hypothetical protein